MSAAAPAAGAESVDAGTFARLWISLACLAGLAVHFSLESHAFTSLMVVVTAGFAVNYFLPLRFRLAFFVALSLAAIGFLLGPVPTLWLVGTGLLLIAMTRLPVPFVARVTLVVLTGAALMTMRGGLVSAPVPAPVWPILGSMFMFRMVVFLYDLKHRPELASWTHALAYFFMLPNVCFPLYPVVDYQMFCRTYYQADRHATHLVGLQWTFRGMVQLLLYRTVYQYFVVEPAAVETVADLGHYLLWPYLLYLKVSGQFHVIVGILRLFGFALPETHHAYFLASSFTDFWRRINIYWKDFMMKVFYYPAFFRLRKLGEVRALVLSTALVFVTTWALHSYQTFWIQGLFLMAWNDVLFWTILGLLVIVAAIREWRVGRRRRLTASVLPWIDTAKTVTATIAMFVTICTLWSFWSTESVETWLSLWSAAIVPPNAGQAGLVAILLAVPVAIAVAVVAECRAWRLPAAWGRLEFQTAALVIASGCLVLASTSRTSAHLGPIGQVMTAVRYGGLNRADLAGLERGYYENLTGLERFNGELWALYMNRPPDWERGLAEAGLRVESPGFVPYSLRPSAEGRFKGVPLRTNRWGLHDKEYERLPPVGCRRLAVLGASHAMGSGVRREDTFEAVLEDRLNALRGPLQGCYEILNFAVYGYVPLYQVDVLNTRVASFKPHAMLYVAHPGDTERILELVAILVSQGSPLPYPELAALVESAGVRAGMTRQQIAQRLAPAGGRAVEWLYRRLADDARRLGIVPGYVMLPMVIEPPQGDDSSRERAAAARAGFVVMDLSDVYAGSDRNSLWVAEWDAHPNAAGHRLIANRLYESMMRQPDVLLATYVSQLVADR